MPRRSGRHPVDIHVGSKLRTQRALLGLSQAALAEKLGISFQQLQKYENGRNRMSAARIWQASRTLGVSVSYFFEGLDDQDDLNDSTDPAPRILNTRAGIEMVRNYENCPDETRKTIHQLSNNLADILGSAAGEEAD